MIMVEMILPRVGYNPFHPCSHSQDTEMMEMVVASGTTGGHFVCLKMVNF